MSLFIKQRRVPVACNHRVLVRQINLVLLCNLVVAVFILKILLTDCRDETCTLVGRGAGVEDRVLCQHKVDRGHFASVELQQVLKQFGSAQVESFFQINEDFLRIDNFLALLNQGLAHLHQLDAGEVVLSVNNSAWVVA